MIIKDVCEFVEVRNKLISEMLQHGLPWKEIQEYFQEPAVMNLIRAEKFENKQSCGKKDLDYLEKLIKIRNKNLRMVYLPMQILDMTESILCIAYDCIVRLNGIKADVCAMSMYGNNNRYIFHAGELQRNLCRLSEFSASFMRCDIDKVIKQASMLVKLPNATDLSSGFPELSEKLKEIVQDECGDKRVIGIIKNNYCVDNKWNSSNVADNTEWLLGNTADSLSSELQSIFDKAYTYAEIAMAIRKKYLLPIGYLYVITTETDKTSIARYMVDELTARGVTEKEIYKVLDKMLAHSYIKSRRRYLFSEDKKPQAYKKTDRRQQVFERYMSGMSVEKILDELGITRATFYSDLKKYREEHPEEEFEFRKGTTPNQWAKFAAEKKSGKYVLEQLRCMLENKQITVEQVKNLIEDYERTGIK